MCKIQTMIYKQKQPKNTKITNDDVKREEKQIGQKQIMRKCQNGQI
ncbi:hypothetical protein pb186bvf_016827 [Paramecium bursaria]